MVVDAPEDVPQPAADAQHAAGPPSAAPRRTIVTVPAALAFALAVGVLAWGVSVWWNRDPSPGAADIGFYDDMTTHHYQAIEMANIYIRNGDDPLMREVAAKISFSQAGDIREMQRALIAWDEVGTPGVAMEWMGMPVDQNAQPGMASEAQMDDLQSARESELDELFSALMIDHHEGGIHMASAAAERANLGEVRDFATIVAESQQAEIDELNQRRAVLGIAAAGGATG